MVLILLACTTTLPGDWSGSVTCPEGDADVAWTVEAASGHFEGTGTGGCIGDCDASYSVTIWPEDDQSWRVDLDDCTEGWFGQTADAACPSVTGFSVAGKTATATWSDCDLELDKQ